jgi:hypothetical protein
LNIWFVKHWFKIFFSIIFILLCLSIFSAILLVRGTLENPDETAKDIGKTARGLIDSFNEGFEGQKIEQNGGSNERD